MNFILPSFIIKPAKSKNTITRNKNIVCRNVVGLIIPNTLINKYDVIISICDNKYPQLKDYCLDNNIIVPLTDESYSCKGKQIIWMKNDTSHTGWIKLIRDLSAVNFMTTSDVYFPFRDNIYVKGDVILINNKLRFKLNRCILDVVEINRIDSRFDSNETDLNNE